MVNFCDYFVIASATSDRRTRAVAQGIEDGLFELGLKVCYRQGLTEGRWALLDTGDIVVHVFEAKLREFYGLEHLWQEAPRVNWQKNN